MLSFIKNSVFEQCLKVGLLYGKKSGLKPLFSKRCCYWI